MDDVTIIFNPQCSKCRTARGMLESEGVEAEVLEYLDTPLTVEELRTLMGQLGLSDPRPMMRIGEDLYAELGLAGRSGDELLQAMAENPILLERPIVVKAGRAVIARPPERVLELFNP